MATKKLEVAKAEILDVGVVVNSMAEIRMSMFFSKWLLIIIMFCLS